MLVIAVRSVAATAQYLPWKGRRHDDDGTESTGEPTPQGLFEAVFRALHDGEQVAIGFDCPLSAATDQVDDNDPAALAAWAGSLDCGPGIEGLRHLVTDLGTWRPWTVVTTSLPHWRATTSVLVWEAVPASGTQIGATAAIDAFYTMLRVGDQPDLDGSTGVVNLAAAVAVKSDVGADSSELTRPAFRILVEVPLVVVP